MSSRAPWRCKYWKELEATRSYPEARSLSIFLSFLSTPSPSLLSFLAVVSCSSCRSPPRSPLFLVLRRFFVLINNSGAQDVVKTLTKVKAFKVGPAESWTRYAALTIITRNLCRTVYCSAIYVFTIERPRSFSFCRATMRSSHPIMKV